MELGSGPTDPLGVVELPDAVRPPSKEPAGSRSRRTRHARRRIVRQTFMAAIKQVAHPPYGRDKRPQDSGFERVEIPNLVDDRAADMERAASIECRHSKEQLRVPMEPAEVVVEQLFGFEQSPQVAPLDW